MGEQLEFKFMEERKYKRIDMDKANKFLMPPMVASASYVFGGVIASILENYGFYDALIKSMESLLK